MRRPKRDSCQIAGCPWPPYRGWLCETHYEEDRVRQQCEADTLCALHTALIDGRLADEQGLRDELFRLRDWWFRACDVLQSNRGTNEMPADEAKYAPEWCMAAAHGIINDERALRSGKKPNSLSVHSRAWVWERFGFLERGLHSNGLHRQPADGVRRTRP